MAHFAIPVSLDSFLTYYPTFTKTNVTTKAGTKISVKLKDPGGSLGGELDGWATALINENASYTTCCMQMSHAVNMAFLGVDEEKMVGLRSYRRANHGEKIASIANRLFRYIASVDEMKAFLDETFEEGVEITSRDDIKDQPGVVVFMGNQFAGIHTEVWTGDNFHQGFMRGNFASLTKPKVWFWSIGDPNPDPNRIDI